MEKLLKDNLHGRLNGQSQFSEVFVRGIAFGQITTPLDNWLPIYVQRNYLLENTPRIAVFNEFVSL